MGFDSIFYLSCFLPAALVLYWWFPGVKGKNGVLLLIGLVFYAFGSFSGLILLIAAGVFNYLMGLLVPKSKVFLILGIAADLAFLCVFKYLTFLLESLLGLPAADLGIAVPLGMSFFLFKAISYLVDTRREPQSGTKNFFRFFLYLSFFPQVTAGPISRYSQFAGQLDRRELTLEGTAKGLRRFLVGLSKKVLLCSAIGAVADGVFGLDTGLLDARLAWLGAIAYCLQIYFDFSGYSDMAIGMGQMLGFSTPENFRYPYVAASIGDFWRRWHISLSSWFRDYLYIPLGGNRKGSIRTAFNKLIVFTLCGLWHGSAWTFLLWGAWHGLFSALESLNVIRAKKATVLGHIYTMLVVCIGFVMFRASDVSQGFAVIGAMFTGLFTGFRFQDAATVQLYRLVNAETVTALIAGAVLALPLKGWIESKPRLNRVAQPVSYILCVILFVLCVMKLAAGGFAPFIYAQF